MKKMKAACILVLLALTALAAGCGKESSKEADPATTNLPVETKQDDGSTLTVREAKGLKTEVRMFADGEVRQVTRGSRPNGRRTASIVLQDGRTVDLRDPADIDRAIEASSAEVTAFARKALGETGAQPANTNTQAQNEKAKKDNP